MRVIRRLMRNILESLNKLHSIGIVHRDIKPQNMIFNASASLGYSLSLPVRGVTGAPLSRP